MAVTFAGVPGFGRIHAAMTAAGTTPVVYPFPWLRPPTDAYIDHLDSTKPFPSFKAFCSLTKPV